MFIRIFPILNRIRDIVRGKGQISDFFPIFNDEGRIITFIADQQSGAENVF